MTPPDALRAAIGRIRELTRNPFAVNLFAWPTVRPGRRGPGGDGRPPRRPSGRAGPRRTRADPAPALVAMLAEQLAVVADERVPVFSFTFGIPTFEAAREAGAVVVGTATSVEEAAALEAARRRRDRRPGERGGRASRGISRGARVLAGRPDRPRPADRRPGRLPGDRLRRDHGRTRDRRGADARGEAAQLGTAFLVTAESGAPDVHKKLVAESSDDATTVTSAYSGRAARAIRTELIGELESSGLEIPPFPLQAMLTRPLHEAAAERERGELMLLLSGQAGGLARPGPAGELVARLVAETERALG